MELFMHAQLGRISNFHATIYWAYEYLSMMGFKLKHISKNGLYIYPSGVDTPLYIIFAAN